ncbi:MAG: C-GCAxxG-C-C family protein [Bacteroidota bacterium]
MKEKESLDYFKNGFNCAQAVFTPFAKENGISESHALKIASGFGGGMGRLQATCGAVTGAYMAIGVKHGKSLGDTGDEKKEKTYSLVKTFDAEFRKIFSTTLCRELLQCDLNTEEGKKYAADNNLTQKVCERCVQEAVKIVEKIL